MSTTAPATCQWFQMWILLFTVMKSLWFHQYQVDVGPLVISLAPQFHRYQVHVDLHVVVKSLRLNQYQVDVGHVSSRRVSSFNYTRLT